MRLLAVSDAHGDLDAVRAALDAAAPDVLLACGDWGDPDQVSLADLEPFTARLPVYTVYGNHDPLDALRAWRNRDGTPVLLENGRIVRHGGLTLVGIGGIWAKSHRKPHYVTDEDVERFAEAAAAELEARGETLDLLLTHGCPSGVADLTWENRHAGQRCFLRAFQRLRPRVYLTGHLHRPQEHRTRDGLVVRNLGQVSRGDATLLTFRPGGVDVAPLAFPR